MRRSNMGTLIAFPYNVPMPYQIDPVSGKLVQAPSLLKLPGQGEGPGGTHCGGNCGDGCCCQGRRGQFRRSRRWGLRGLGDDVGGGFGLDASGGFGGGDITPFVDPSTLDAGGGGGSSSGLNDLSAADIAALQDGTYVPPAGTVFDSQTGQGTNIFTNTDASGGITLPDGSYIGPTGTTILSDGTGIFPDGSTILPDGTYIDTAGNVFPPNTAQAQQAQASAAPSRSGSSGGGGGAKSGGGGGQQQSLQQLLCAAGLKQFCRGGAQTAAKPAASSSLSKIFNSSNLPWFLLAGAVVFVLPQLLPSSGRR